MKAMVLDSWAVIAYFENEPSAGKIEHILLDSIESGTAHLMSIINLGEVWYNYAREGSESAADAVVEDIVNNLGVRIIDADWEITRIAAGLKSKYSVSYADCFAAAVAKFHAIKLVTGDPEFKRLKKEIKILSPAPC